MQCDDGSGGGAPGTSGAGGWGGPGSSCGGGGRGVPASAAAAAAAGASGSGPQPQGAPSSALAACLDQFRSGANGLQAMLEDLVGAAAAEAEALARERAAVAAARAALDEEAGRVAAVLDSGEQVTLNVGGARFTTTVGTLRGAPSPSLFSAMFSGRHELRRGPDGAIFIDRDSRHFSDVLNFLRTGQLAYPPDGTDWKYLLELRAEAEFYGLAGLTAAIDRYPWGLVKATRAAAIDTEAHWVYEDGDDEVVLTVNAPCQLHAVGLCGAHGGYTAQLTVLEVAAADFGALATLGGGSAAVTRADGPVARLDLAEPVTLVPGRTYMLSLRCSGSDSMVGEDCLDTLVAGGVRLSVLEHESPNGTSAGRGQVPCLWLRPLPTM